MITKAGPELRGDRTEGLMRYLLGPGRHTVHEDPRIIGGWIEPANMLGVDETGRVAYTEATRRDGTTAQRPQVSGLAKSMDARLQLGREAMRARKPVWHCVINNHPDDPVLSDDQWADIAERHVQAVGLQDCRWAAVRHDDQGIHVVATLADSQGRRMDRLPREFERLGKARVAAEKQYCTVRTDPGTRTGGIAYKRHEMEKARREDPAIGRTDGPVAAKIRLRRAMAAAAAGTNTPADFRARLGQYGVQAKWRFSDRNPGEITGYKVALEGHVNAEGDPVWYAASQIDKQLSWPKIQQAWHDRERMKIDPERSDAVLRNDYTARLRVAAKELRAGQGSANELKAGVADMATALAHTCPKQAAGAAWGHYADNAWWASRTSGGVGARRARSYTARSLSAAARALVVRHDGHGDEIYTWAAITAQLGETLRALADAHEAAGALRQAQQARAAGTFATDRAAIGGAPPQRQQRRPVARTAGAALTRRQPTQHREGRGR